MSAETAWRFPQSNRAPRTRTALLQHPKLAGRYLPLSPEACFWRAARLAPPNRKGVPCAAPLRERSEDARSRVIDGTCTR
jgi:hypothetical protein